ncbi:acyltransferase [Pseudomonas brassicacearum]|uniref:N-acetyltransferase n=1 Tax=Pseudomonas brassicacearum subsp. neoaurantiaca TaxID=494916 RepID=A0A7V8RMM0_9PSED|nr:acyltransferase [Pseudomonas brassicacearum]MBA1379321.1 N-acetyltransferase [Pseudomonas brassicacearum subsp. neoaurantiaca]
MTEIHPLSDVKSVHIGKNTRVWQYSVIFENAIIGEDCNICAHTLIESDVIIGSRVTVKSGVFIWNGARIEDDVFIGPNVTFTNDSMPRSRVYPDAFEAIHICKGASIGANATLLPGIKVGSYSMIGAGAVVTRDVPDYAVVVGNPAKITRYLK